MLSTSRTKRNFARNQAHSPRFEPLEERRMFCALHMPAKVTQIQADQLVQSDSRTAGADIVWANRATTTSGGTGDTDGFGATFGTSAPIARAVADAVIVQYEKMIGSFNYGVAGSYSLTLNMNGSGGYGGALTQIGFYNNKPAAGVMSIRSGNNSANANDDNGWFLDPTPFEHSEFQGNIVNAFAGDAYAGSPAANKSDFYTVVAAEMTHALGLIGSYTPLWANHTVNTGVTDTAEGQGTGQFWVFNGPSIKHLLTSNNGGPSWAGGTDTGMAIHAAGPGVNVAYNGDTYVGAEDQGNAVFELGRRYLVNETSALMFKDAYGYSVNPAATEGTFYANYNQSNRILYIVGGDAAAGHANSNDNVTITRVGSKIRVSVDIGNDVAGTGALPGAGDLPAWVSEFDANAIDLIGVSTGDGTDSISVSADLGEYVIVNGGFGPETDTFNFFDSSGSVSWMRADAGFYDSSAGTRVEMSGDEEIQMMTGSSAPMTFNIIGTMNGRPLTVNGGSASDTFNLAFLNGSRYPAPVTINAGGGANDTMVVNDSQLAGNSSYSLNDLDLWKSNGFAGAHFSGMDGVTLYGEQGTNDFNVEMSGAGFPVRLDGGPTQDSYRVQTTGAGGPTYILSSAGDDTLSLGKPAGFWFLPAQVVLGSSMTFGSISILPTSRMDVTAGSQSTITTKNLSLLAPPSVLNLNDNDFILDYSGASQLGTVQGLINYARNGGAWNSSFGITSDVARDKPLHNTTLGAMEATDYKSIYGAGATFNGQSIDNTAVLVKYTYYGDADFNGVVNFDDYSRIDGGFLNNRSGWLNGDFDGNGVVNFDDYSLIDLAFNTQGSTLRPPVSLGNGSGRPARIGS